MTMTQAAPTAPTIAAAVPEARQATAEQQTAIDKFNTGENLVIIALAGTGKTTTLRMLAEQDPQRPGLYLSFNKAISKDAEAKFAGTNVTCKTAHSLAYGQFGAPRRHRLEARMNPTETAKFLEMKGMKFAGFGMNHTVLAASAMKVVMDTVNRFCGTADAEITAEHVSLPERLQFSVNDAGLMKTSGDKDARAEAVAIERAATVKLIETIVDWAKVYWSHVLDLRSELPVTHSHYLKLWSLSNPKLPYSYILYDEAQDSDPATTSVVLGQTHAQVVAVGDNQQSIYAWRGAVNSLSFFGGEVVYLSQSFRFGEEIAEFANVMLDILEAPIHIKGTPGKRSSVFTEHQSQRTPNAILCRTNGGAMTEILYWLRQDFKVCIAGEKKAAELRAIAQAALDLQVNHWTKHPDFKDFRRWEDVVASVADEEDGDAGLNSMVNVIVRQGEGGAENIIAAIDSCVSAEEADITVSTVHVSKGLEWTHVRISPDFRSPKVNKDTGEVEPLDVEEAKILYVAITRAKRHLDAQHIAWILDFNGGVA
jgi:hypothetical protein